MKSLKELNWVSFLRGSSTPLLLLITTVMSLSLKTKGKPWQRVLKYLQEASNNCSTTTEVSWRLSVCLIQEWALFFIGSRSILESNWLSQTAWTAVIPWLEKTICISCLCRSCYLRLHNTTGNLEYIQWIRMLSIYKQMIQ